MTLDSLIVGLVYLCIPWICLEIASQVFFARSGRGKILSRRQRSSSLGLLQPSASRRTWISRGPLWIKIETTRFNDLPKRLLYLFDRVSSTGRKGATRRFHGDDDVHGVEWGGSGRFLDTVRRSYDYGSIFAGMALLGSIAFLLWGAFDLISKIVILQEIHPTAAQETVDSILGKRSESGPFGQTSTTRSTGLPTLVPLIPGVTIPFSHLWPLLVALSLTQVIHEAGHAICAAMHSWTPLDTGLILIFPCIPGAFVNLPREALEGGDDAGSHDVRPKRSAFSTPRMQIVSAGVWHNAISALFVALIIYSGISTTAHHIFWKSADALEVEGIQVVRTSAALQMLSVTHSLPYPQSSPLVQHMPSGTVISKVDDQDLATTAMTSTDSATLWRKYLTEDYGKQDSEHLLLGWCVSRKTWIQEQTACCDDLDASSSATITDGRNSGLCFQTVQERGTDGKESPGRCFDPVRLVSGKKESRRCSITCPDPAEVCIAADPREQLIRITVQQPANKAKARVVLFQGSAQAIYAAITLVRYRSRIPWFPLSYSVFEWWNLFVSYFLNLSIAMAILNMLPLPTLDGDVYSSFILQAVFAQFHRLEDTSTSSGSLTNHASLSDDVELGVAESSSTRSSWRTQPTARRGSLGDDHQEREDRRHSRHHHHLLNASLLTRIHARFRWFTVLLAIFVFGGSIILHATGDGAPISS